MTFIYFILILGIVVFVHEFGHYLSAKKAGIYVYEFSIGMGPKIFKFNRKKKVKTKKGKIKYVPDETDYCIRLFPIGGFVQMAGEEVEVDEKIPEEQRFQSKTWVQKMLTVSAGVLNVYWLLPTYLIIDAFTPVSSFTSRTDVSLYSSPFSTVPFGKTQPSYLFL